MWKWVIILGTFLTVHLNAEPNVLAFAGSTRQDSVNKKLINEAARIAKELGANILVVDLSQYPLPLYDADLEAANGMPENARLLRQYMLQSQVILIASPEYNHSIPGVLKNVLDWVSRNEKAERSRDAFQDKKFAIMSASPGKKGGAKGLVHLRDILLDQRGIVLAQQVSVPDADHAFDDQDRLISRQHQSDLHELIQEALKVE